MRDLRRLLPHQRRSRKSLQRCVSQRKSVTGKNTNFAKKIQLTSIDLLNKIFDFMPQRTIFFLTTPSVCYFTSWDCTVALMQKSIQHLPKQHKDLVQHYFFGTFRPQASLNLRPLP